MSNFLKNTLFSGFLLFFIGLNANLLAQSQCVSVENVARNAALHPELIAKRQLVQNAVDAHIIQQENSVQSRTVITIPVVVHVVFNGNNENITDAQINSQIEVLNIDFRKMNTNANNIPTEFVSIVADTEIEFCLASIDPVGMPTTGITRKSTNISNISMSYAPDGRVKVCHNSLGGTSAWDETKYLNIWVAKIGSGILGYATFPGTTLPGEDGVFIDARYFGKTGLAIQNPPNHLGRTAIHEIGHYLDLKHIWGEEDNSCNDDDGVTDTPQQRNSYSGCPVHPQLSCGNPAMFMNYMDYTVDGCMSMFTQGQKARMQATLATVRSGLLTSNGCGTNAAFEPSEKQLQVKVSPNPTADVLSFSVLQLNFEPMKYAIYDGLGKLVLKGNIDKAGFQQIDISRLLSGAYVLKLEGKKEISTERFIVK
jgi:Pregnancy-associated plasma protein-A/Secretion system C-terminal sorting domain